MDRRTFLQSLASITASIMMYPSFGQAATPKSDALGELLPTRTLGKTGEEVTMLGLGGAHVGTFDQHAEAMIETAIEGGVRFFDTANKYQNGGSERLYGQYLVPKYREHVFIMSKADKFSGQEVRDQLDQTLLRLNTDYLDLWQMHEVWTPEDVDTRIDQGVVDVFLEAKEQGKVRHIGFTGHQNPYAHLRVLERTDFFETCQMPINCADPSYGSFIKNVLPTLVERNMGVIAMKTLACGGFFGGDTWFQGGSKPKICPDLMSVEEAIHFVWSLPVSVLITGPNNPEQLQEKIDFAKSFAQMTEETRDSLINKVAHLTPQAGVEFYKSEELQVELWNKM